jgi:hypothetical protein
LKDFRDAISKEKRQQINEDNHDVESYFQRLFADGDQLERILIARKYELKPSVELFWEQVRFRARWKPDLIRAEDISTALSCEFSFCWIQLILYHHKQCWFAVVALFECIID